MQKKVNTCERKREKWRSKNGTILERKSIMKQTRVNKIPSKRFKKKHATDEKVAPQGNNIKRSILDTVESAKS